MVHEDAAGELDGSDRSPVYATPQRKQRAASEDAEGCGFSPQYASPPAATAAAAASAAATAASEVAAPYPALLSALGAQQKENAAVLGRLVEGIAAVRESFEVRGARAGACRRRRHVHGRCGTQKSEQTLAESAAWARQQFQPHQPARGWPASRRDWFGAATFLIVLAGIAVQMWCVSK